MTDLAAAREQALVLPIPSILVRTDRRPWAPPVRVPELASCAIGGIRVRGDVDGRVPDGSRASREPSDVSLASDLDGLRVERMELESKLPGLRSELSALLSELARLKREIRAAHVDRDGIQAVAIALREQIAELSVEQREQEDKELSTLRREVQVLRRMSSELHEPVVRFRIPTEILRIGFWNGKQHFDDS
jgi:cell division protein FtsB